MAPGDPAVTLPFTQSTLLGFDIDPITDFRGDRPATPEGTHQPKAARRRRHASPNRAGSPALATTLHRHAPLGPRSGPFVEIRAGQPSRAESLSA
jgi:hypothetical protein